MVISATSPYFYGVWTIASPDGAFEFSLSACTLSLLGPCYPSAYAARNSKSIIKGLYSTQSLSSVAPTAEKSEVPKFVGLSPFDPPEAFIFELAEMI